MELGNLMFNTNNKNQRYYCPDWVIALLADIDNKLSLVYWNKNQLEYESPFQNTGNEFHNSVFDVYAYAWEEDASRDYNFKCSNVEISWYKWFGRDTTINIDPQSDTFADSIISMYNKALSSIRDMEDFDE